MFERKFEPTSLHNHSVITTAPPGRQSWQHSQRRCDSRGQGVGLPLNISFMYLCQHDCSSGVVVITPDWLWGDVGSISAQGKLSFKHLFN